MNFFKKSLLAQIVGYFSLLSIVIVSLVVGTAYIQARDALKQSVLDRLRVAASLKEYQLDEWINNQRQDVLLTSQLTEVKNLVAILLNTDESSFEYQEAYQKLNKFFFELVKFKPTMKDIFITTKNGIIIFSTDKNQVGKYQPLGNTTTYFTREQVDSVVPNFYRSPITNKSAITFATPILNAANQRLAVIAVNLDLHAVDDLIRERTGLGESGETYLVGRSGNKTVFISVDESEEKNFSEGIQSAGINEAIAQKDGFGLYQNYAGVPVIGVYNWLDKHNLALIVEMKQQEAFALARQLAGAIWLIGITSVALLTSGVFLLARQISRPILAIADTARQVRREVQTISFTSLPTAPVLTQDEIGILARDFNQMTEQLTLYHEQLEDYSRTLEQKVYERTRELQQEQAKSERLLLNILPKAIVEKLKQNQGAIAEHFEDATILFSDIVGFTPISARMSATELVSLLNQIFSVFDHLAEEHGLEKIKTIGDAYMVAAGLPILRSDHAEAIAAMALDMQKAVQNFQTDLGEPLQIRIGINTGPVVAGVIGISKFIYDLWGDTVNIASRMESLGAPGDIQVTASTYELLKDKFLLEKRGTINVKGKGDMTTYWLVGKL